VRNIDCLCVIALFVRYFVRYRLVLFDILTLFCFLDIFYIKI